MKIYNAAIMHFVVCISLNVQGTLSSYDENDYYDSDGIPFIPFKSQITEKVEVENKIYSTALFDTAFENYQANVLNFAPEFDTKYDFYKFGPKYAKEFPLQIKKKLSNKPLVTKKANLLLDNLPYTEKALNLSEDSKSNGSNILPEIYNGRSSEDHVLFDPKATESSDFVHSHSFSKFSYSFLSLMNHINPNLINILERNIRNIKSNRDLKKNQTSVETVSIKDKIVRRILCTCEYCTTGEPDIALLIVSGKARKNNSTYHKLRFRQMLLPENYSKGQPTVFEFNVKNTVRNKFFGNIIHKYLSTDSPDTSLLPDQRTSENEGHATLMSQPTEYKFKRSAVTVPPIFQYQNDELSICPKEMEENVNNVPSKLNVFIKMNNTSNNHSEQIPPSYIENENNCDLNINLLNNKTIGQTCKTHFPLYDFDLNLPQIQVKTERPGGKLFRTKGNKDFLWTSDDLATDKYLRNTHRFVFNLSDIIRKIKLKGSGKIYRNKDRNDVPGTKPRTYYTSLVKTEPEEDIHADHEKTLTHLGKDIPKNYKTREETLIKYKNLNCSPGEEEHAQGKHSIKEHRRDLDGELKENMNIVAISAKNSQRIEPQKYKTSNAYTPMYILKIANSTEQYNAGTGENVEFLDTKCKSQHFKLFIKDDINKKTSNKPVEKIVFKNKYKKNNKNSPTGNFVLDKYLDEFQKVIKNHSPDETVHNEFTDNVIEMQIGITHPIITKQKDQKHLTKQLLRNTQFMRKNVSGNGLKMIGREEKRFKFQTTARKSGINYTHNYRKKSLLREHIKHSENDLFSKQIVKRECYTEEYTTYTGGPYGMISVEDLSDAAEVTSPRAINYHESEPYLNYIFDLQNSVGEAKVNKKIMWS